MVIFPYQTNPPSGTYNIESAISYIIKLSSNGIYKIQDLENVISKITERYGVSWSDHEKTLNRLKQSDLYF